MLLAATAARAGQCVQHAGKKEEEDGGWRDNGWVLLQSNVNNTTRLSNASQGSHTPPTAYMTLSLIVLKHFLILLDCLMGALVFQKTV